MCWFHGIPFPTPTSWKEKCCYCSLPRVSSSALQRARRDGLLGKVLVVKAWESEFHPQHPSMGCGFEKWFQWLKLLRVRDIFLLLLIKAIKFGCHCTVDVGFVSSPLNKTGSHLRKQKNPERQIKKKTQDFRTGEAPVPHLSPLKHSLSCPCLLKSDWCWRRSVFKSF